MRQLMSLALLSTSLGACVQPETPVANSPAPTPSPIARERLAADTCALLSQTEVEAALSAPIVQVRSTAPGTCKYSTDQINGGFQLFVSQLPDARSELESYRPAGDSSLSQATSLTGVGDQALWSRNLLSSEYGPRFNLYAYQGNTFWSLNFYLTPSYQPDEAQLRQAAQILSDLLEPRFDSVEWQEQ